MYVQPVWLGLGGARSLVSGGSVIPLMVSDVPQLLGGVYQEELYRPLRFLARDSIYAIARYMPSPVRLAVRLSVRHTGGSVKDGSR